MQDRRWGRAESDSLELPLLASFRHQKLNGSLPSQTICWMLDASQPKNSDHDKHPMLFSMQDQSLYHAHDPSFSSPNCLNVTNTVPLLLRRIDDVSSFYWWETLPVEKRLISWEHDIHVRIHKSRYNNKLRIWNFWFVAISESGALASHSICRTKNQFRIEKFCFIFVYSTVWDVDDSGRRGVVIIQSGHVMADISITAGLEFVARSSLWKNLTFFSQLPLAFSMLPRNRSGTEPRFPVPVFTNKNSRWALFAATVRRVLVPSNRISVCAVSSIRQTRRSWSNCMYSTCSDYF